MTARITQPGGTRYFSYLPTGQVSGDQRNPSSDYIFSFNNSGRLASANLNQGGLGVYTYNGLEQRAIKAAATTTDFLYDQAGHMIAEANHLTGVMIREYIWRDDTPVALVVYSANGSTSTVYDIHADQLNRPQKITTQNASVVWDGVFDPFGNPSGITGSVTVPLMFPGQYWDSETQLSQNWNRDYDPTIGRYIESDPIGLKGGVDTYAYANSNPQRYADPTGKFVILLPFLPEIAEAIGAGAELYLGMSAADATAVAAGAGGLAMAMPAGLSGEQQAEFQEDWENYHKICDEQPPPCLKGADMYRWKLEKAQACKKARQDFADKWYGGQFDPAHQNVINELNQSIANLEQKLGLR